MFVYCVRHHVYKILMVDKMNLKFKLFESLIEVKEQKKKVLTIFYLITYIKKARCLSDCCIQVFFFKSKLEIQNNSTLTGIEHIL